MLLQYDSELGHRFVPHLAARVPNELGGYYVRTNAQGFRSEIEFVKRKSGKPRVLFFGDSFTAGDGVDNRARFSDLIAEELNAEAFNYGLPGSGTDQQLLTLEGMAKDVEADLIVLSVYVENIERIVAPARVAFERATGRRLLIPKPYFTLEAGRLLLHNQPVPRHRKEAEERVRTTSDEASGLLYGARRIYRRLPKLVDLADRTRSSYPRFWSRLYGLTRFDPYPSYRSRRSDGWRRS